MIVNHKFFMTFEFPWLYNLNKFLDEIARIWKWQFFFNINESIGIVVNLHVHWTMNIYFVNIILRCWSKLRVNLHTQTKNAEKLKHRWHRFPFFFLYLTKTLARASVKNRILFYLKFISISFVAVVYIFTFTDQWSIEFHISTALLIYSSLLFLYLSLSLFPPPSWFLSFGAKYKISQLLLARFPLRYRENMPSRLIAL